METWPRRLGIALKILGIDPGTNILGLAAIRPAQGPGLRFYLADEIRSHKLEGDKPAKLFRIHRLVSEAIFEHKVDYVAIECGYVGKNPRTSLTLAEARGAAIAAIRYQGRLIEVMPSIAKLASTGNGFADKLHVRRLIQTQLRLKDLPDPDAADAAAVALAAFGTPAVRGGVPSLT